MALSKSKADPLKNALPFERPIRELDLKADELRAELHKDKGEDAKSHLEVIDADRECDEHMEFHPALSPKEHIEMKLLRQVEARNREWRDEEMRLQDEFEKRMERRHNTTLAVQFLLALLAAAVALIAAKLLPFF